MTVPIGEVTQQPGLCTRCMNWDKWQEGASEILCAKPATVHVAYDAQIENGFCCADHWAEFQQKWVYWDVHDAVAPPCGYPESLWDFDLKRCRWPSGHRLATASVALTSTLISDNP